MIKGLFNSNGALLTTPYSQAIGRLSFNNGFLYDSRGYLVISG